MSLILFILLLMAPDPALFALQINSGDQRSIQVKRLIGLIIGGVLQISLCALVVLILEAKYSGFAVFGSFLLAMYLFNRSWRLLNGKKEIAHRIPTGIGGAIVWRLQHLALPAAYWLIQPFTFEGRVNPYDIVTSAQMVILVAAASWGLSVFFPVPIEQGKNDRGNAIIRISHMISIAVLLILLVRIWL